jgi:DNA-binding GntR family transcriptional regulator
MTKLKNDGISRSSIVYKRLKKKIISGEIQPNTPLTEEALAGEYEVSRTPIREALNKLAQDDLVEILPRRGVFVKGLTITDIEEIYTVREALEGISAKMSVDVIGEPQITTMERSLIIADNEFAKGNDQLAFKIGNELHDTILKIAGNKRIITTVSNLRDNIQRLHIISASIPGRLEQSNKEHWEIFYAIKDRNGDLAQKKMMDHIAGTKRSVIQTIRNSINVI